MKIAASSWSNILRRLAFFDLNSWTLIGGIGLLTTGAAMVYVPAAFIVPGSILTLIAVGGKPK